MDDVKRLYDESLSKIFGGNSKFAKIDGKNAIWKPVCPSCNKEMPGGAGVIRIKKDGASHPYFCTECAEKYLNSGEATIDKGFEDHYQKYEKYTNASGTVIYGWKLKK